ncbi:MAG: bifunctional transaldolase/phosoglucose isomerase [Ignavibacteriaceae bacterium]|nr:bifunctional transaldolase/phosoglucose isomerase [Ignavibacteriaceae bacterium]
MSNPIVELSKFGQSIWLDNISRGMLKKGELKNLIDEINLKGVTSNPSIFQKAISQGSDYDEQLLQLLAENKDASPKDLYEALAVKDIRDAADVLLPVYKKTNGIDGYVSLEVSPDLAYKTEATIEEARRLFKWVNKPNVMIKIPATLQGLPAIKKVISEGINVNVTLIFSPKMYADVVGAFISGLEERAANGQSVKNVASVASFFISRIDSLVDKLLEEKGNKALQGRAAIDNAKLVYQNGKKLFASERFKKLEDIGAQKQRLLWASTSTKNPSYLDILYVEELIGTDTVNTVPPSTLDAYKDHGKPEVRIENDINTAASNMNKLEEAGINFEAVTDKLLKDGVKLFADAFVDLLAGVEKKKDLFLSLSPDVNINPELKKKVEARLKSWKDENTLSRFLNADPTVWKEKKEDDKELSDRLGWLTLPEEMQTNVEDLIFFVEEVKSLFDDVVVLGMGGSSLAPEVFFKTFGKQEGYPTLSVCDSTHPDAVKALNDKLDLNRTLFIVASKSGGTTETMSFFYFFYSELKKLTATPGNNFIAITDPDSSLEKLASEKQFRKIFLTQPNVGGRFSALTYFGLVPAALIGVDVNRLLKEASLMHIACKEKNLNANPGLYIGALLGELALAGKDKLTFISSQNISSFPTWVEQLVAESTGKEGKGILPVVDEIFYSPDTYNQDRVFVNLQIKNDETNNDQIKALTDSGFSVINFLLNDKYDIGKQFFLWEAATALTGAVLKINPFNQPNVQLAKSLANESMKSYKETGRLPKENPVGIKGNVAVYGDVPSFDEAVNNLTNDISSNNYIAIMAFIAPDEKTNAALAELRQKLTAKYKTAVTIGYGPRFLHSTGQLHKGDGNKGLFIQITSSAVTDIEVPEKGYSFYTLVTAQAQGDLKALQNSGRRVIRFHIEDDIIDGIKKITASV